MELDILHEQHICKEKNLMMSELRVFNGDKMIYVDLQIVDLSTNTKAKHIDNIDEYEWVEIK